MSQTVCLNREVLLFIMVRKVVSRSSAVSHPHFCRISGSLGLSPGVWALPPYEYLYPSTQSILAKASSILKHKLGSSPGSPPKSRNCSASMLFASRFCAMSRFCQAIYLFCQCFATTDVCDAAGARPVPLGRSDRS